MEDLQTDERRESSQKVFVKSQEEFEGAKEDIQKNPLDKKYIVKQLLEIYSKKPHLKGHSFSIDENGKIIFGM